MLRFGIYKRITASFLITLACIMAGCSHVSTDTDDQVTDSEVSNDSGNIVSGLNDDLAKDFTKKKSIYLDPGWEWADFSEINSGCAVLYTASSDRKDIVIGVNAGHGTIGGEEVRTYCHPDKSPKITTGTNPAGSLKADAISIGMIFHDGATEAEVTLHEAQILRDKLLEQGYDVLMLRDAQDVQLDNVARSVMANNMTDCLISLHWDGDGLGYDKGCFYVPVPDEIKDMEPVASHWREHERLGKALIAGLKDNGVPLYKGWVNPLELTQTCYATVPSVVVELGNAASVHDDATLEKLADGLILGIEKWVSKEDPTVLKDSVASPEGLGEDAIIGTCIGANTAADEKFMELVEKHFNAVTLENELKPESVLKRNNSEVPTLDHSQADALLDKILEWNADNPDDRIKVRGHVLVWHSQTPEWFFHVDYDKNKDYASKDEMNARMEWYIKSMLEYYTGEDSKYKDLFYGWDVVNEAISDRTGSYRTDTDRQGSNWWKIYESNEYIINAFKYANTYAPADLDLYYNDYNECDKKKKKGILTLIEEVKAAQGTRIDGFGMQGHYQVYSPTAEVVEEAAREYASAAGKVMITEFDTKPSMLFNGSDEAIPDEYERQAKYCAQVYDALKNLRRDGVDIEGITFWGVTDPYSWLQKDKKCFPLLFDGDYKPKPAFYSFAED